MPEKKPIGKITHYYPDIGVAVIALNSELKTGDKISVKSKNGDFEQDVKSMQVEHKSIKAAKAKQVVGLKVDQPVKENDLVFKA